MLRRVAHAVLLFATLLGPVPAAADYMAGWAALHGGDAEGARDAWIGNARAGDVDLQFAVGLLHESGLLGEIDRRAALEWYRAASSRGLAAAQTRLARMYATGTGVEPDLALATDLLTKAAESGYAAAQYNLGVAYERGQGVPLDPDFGALWYRRAAAQRLPQALYALGRIAMAEGAGDPAQALSWYRAAAEAGLAEAANNIGLLYERGEGVARDPVAAARWYRVATDQGLAIAQNNLGQLLQYGQGLERNPVSATVFYKQAAYGGDAFGQVNYANALANGIGVEPDMIEAYAWILLARIGGQPEAVAMATEYARRMRPDLDADMRHAAIARATVLRQEVATEVARREALRLMPIPTEEMGAPIVAAQRYLKVLGYLNGVVDGIAGPGTVAAATRFQRDAGLPAEGRIDEALVAALVAAAHAPPEADNEEENGDAVD